MLELAFRGRISMQKDPSRRRFPLPDRVIEVIDDTLTGEVLLDEALKMMKTSEKMSVSSWIDLMSGTTFSRQLSFFFCGPLAHPFSYPCHDLVPPCISPYKTELSTNHPHS